MDNVEEYRFEPIKGYQMLQWHGKRPFTSTVYYPAQHRETYGEAVNGWRNRIYWGDNLQVMSHLLKEFRGAVQLIYIDPPFDSKADYKRQIELRDKTAANDRSVFEEKQYEDIWTNDEYLQFMYERIVLLRELLADNGSIYLHCDWRKVHLLRCIMDEVFGSSCFVNEVIWYYKTGGVPSKLGFGRKHDNVLFYAKAPSSARWNEIKEKSYLMHDYGFSNVEILEDDIGRYTVVHLRDVWDIPALRGNQPEKQDYPTQKPEALLERIIRASSDVGDLVFDCFMGSGTTQAVAMKLGRRYIGADINLGSVQITTKRLIAAGAELQESQLKLELGDDVQAPTTHYTGFEIYNVNNYDIFRNPVEAKDLLLQALEVNRLQAGNLFEGEKDGRMVKVMPINRIATRQDLNELITGLDYKAFERRKAEHPSQPVERITLVCMGHEPGLAAFLQQEVPYRLDIEVVDILRDRQDLRFKRDSEARVFVQDGYLVIDSFYPWNLLSKLSMEADSDIDWRQLVESVMIDWNYDGAVLQPTVLDIPEGNELVAGRYPIPDDAGTIKVKITDLLSESFEVEVSYG
ncbi:MAG: site-specific DNA-methyltransferase [Anaerolineae bacterium]|nr:site-specific DNA-methyltransferase [Anaerolineae bacterium]